LRMRIKTYIFAKIMRNAAKIGLFNTLSKPIVAFSVILYDFIR
jgi:hypothetical protein